MSEALSQHLAPQTRPPSAGSITTGTGALGIYTAFWQQHWRHQHDHRLWQHYNSGTYAHGIYNRGSTNTTTVSGSITTTGTNAHGIYNYGDNNTTTISGTVKATGAKSAALYRVR
jgi:hypothetical protein